MTVTIATEPPIEAVAGDTWQWTVTPSTYTVALGFTLAYRLAGASTLAWDARYVTTSGDTHTVTIPASATALLTPGRYELTALYTGSGAYAGQRFSEACPPVTVRPDPTQQAPGDRLAFAERNLAAVEAALTARLAGDQPEEYTIGNRSVRRMTTTELMRLREQLKAEVRSLRRPTMPRQTIGVRFTRPL